jgi:hypothetical protein
MTNNISLPPPTPFSAGSYMKQRIQGEERGGQRHFTFTRSISKMFLNFQNFTVNLNFKDFLQIRLGRATGTPWIHTCDVHTHVQHILDTGQMHRHYKQNKPCASLLSADAKSDRAHTKHLPIAVVGRPLSKYHMRFHKLLK